jgi:hypothetical protein
MVTRELEKTLHSYRIPLLIKACAEKYGVTLSQSGDRAEATGFNNVGTLLNFVNDVEKSLINYDVSNFGIGTSYNPYCVRIRW